VRDAECAAGEAESALDAPGEALGRVGLVRLGGETRGFADDEEVVVLLDDARAPRVAAEPASVAVPSRVEVDARALAWGRGWAEGRGGGEEELGGMGSSEGRGTSRGMVVVRC
jgi:hypothetical protein